MPRVAAEWNLQTAAGSEDSYHSLHADPALDLALEPPAVHSEFIENAACGLLPEGHGTQSEDAGPRHSCSHRSNQGWMVPSWLKDLIKPLTTVLVAAAEAVAVAPVRETVLASVSASRDWAAAKTAASVIDLARRTRPIPRGSSVADAVFHKRWSM